MKKLVCFIFFGLASTLQALGLSDIPNMLSGSEAVYAAATALREFSRHIKILNDQSWQFTIAGSTEAVSVTNAQKQGLVARYTNLVTALDEARATLP